VVRGERLIKLSDSWFSAKSILVDRFKKKTFVQVEHLIKDGGENFTEFIKTPNGTNKAFKTDRL